MDETLLFEAIKAGHDGGISTARGYLQSLTGCLADETCSLKYLQGVGYKQWQSALEDSSSVLVYRNEDMDVLGGKHLDTGRKFGRFHKNRRDATPSSLLEFDCILTSTRKDRDGDVLESKGAEVDQKMPLLWQHVPFLPIGKMISLLGQNEKRIAISCAIADVPMGRDAVTLVEFGALRISHGFKPVKFEPLDKKDKEDPYPPGWHVTQFKIMEVSLVSVPSNEDAIITAFSREKLTHPLVKGWAEGYFQKRTRSVPTTINTPHVTVEVKVTQEPVKKNCTCDDHDKGAVPFKATPKADENHVWDANGAITRLRNWAGVNADKPSAEAWTKYSQGFAWFDGENKENFGSYKLPHHDVDNGRLVVVWKGVAAAMAAMMGSRGGVAIPESDKERVHSHLAGHYKQFDKEVPKSLLDLEYEDATEIKDHEVLDGKPFPNNHTCRVKDPGEFQTGSFRTMKRDHGGKEYLVVVGRLKGKTTMSEQSYRYPKASWSVSEARSHCRSHDGTFVAARESDYSDMDLKGTMAREDHGKLNEAMDHVKQAMDHPECPMAGKTMLTRSMGLVKEVADKHNPDDKARKKVSKEDVSKLNEAAEHMDAASSMEKMPSTCKTCIKAARVIVKSVADAHADNPPAEPQMDDGEDKAANLLASRFLGLLLSQKRINPGILAEVRAATEEAYRKCCSEALSRFIK